MLNASIQDSDILSAAQKKVLTIICDSNYPISCSSILDLMGTSKQAAHFSLTRLLDREFITRAKDRVFVYQANPTRMAELIERYKNKLQKK